VPWFRGGWGGTHRWVSVPKLHLLVRDTLTLIRRAHCSGLELSHIVGRWSWALLACRPAFAVFSSVYRFIQTAGSRVFHLWPSVARELDLAIGLAPLLFASLDSPWFDRVVASDASQGGLGVVAARVPAARVAAMARLRTPGPQPDPGPGSQSLNQQAPVSSLALDPLSLHGLRWSTIVSAPWVHLDPPEHINVLELRSLTTAVRWVLSNPPSGRRRLLLITDSTVVAHSVSKGRSSSFQILRRLRYLSALVLASGLQIFCRWVPTVNPADGASRRYAW
jgi:hypothetical protein